MTRFIRVFRYAVAFAAAILLVMVILVSALIGISPVGEAACRIVATFAGAPHGTRCSVTGGG